MEPKVIKFNNGELVIGTLRSNNEESLWIENPIAVVPYPVMQNDMMGETFLLKPWIGISDEKTFLIPTSEIVTICTLRKNLLEQYNRYIANPTPPEEDPPEDLDMDLETIRAAMLRDKNLLN
ncbi:hypothetical protein EBV26_13350 [bacterium]|nr:hypothetical protein [bacterium]